MIQRVLGRVAQAALSLLVVTVIVFTVTRLTGDPVLVLLPADATPEMYESLRRELGLDRPIPIQYLNFLGDLLQGDLGQSIRTDRDVSEVILERVPATLELGGAALLVSIAVGVPLGLFAGYWRGSSFDRTARLVAVLGQSAPAFWVGLLLIYYFSVKLGIFPAGGRGTLAQLVLPTMAMALASIAGVTRLMRSSLLETLETDYIKFCRVKGISETKILWKHGLRNAGLPVLTYGGVLAGSLITGSVVTEAVFVWPGLGRLMIEAIQFRDFPVVQGTVLVLSLAYIAINLSVDVAYDYLNPRLRGR